MNHHLIWIWSHSALSQQPWGVIQDVVFSVCSKKKKKKNNQAPCVLLLPRPYQGKKRCECQLLRRVMSNLLAVSCVVCPQCNSKDTLQTVSGLLGAWCVADNMMPQQSPSCQAFIHNQQSHKSILSSTHTPSSSCAHTHTRPATKDESCQDGIQCSVLFESDSWKWKNSNQSLFHTLTLAVSLSPFLILWRSDAAFTCGKHAWPNKVLHMNWKSPNVC